MPANKAKAKRSWPCLLESLIARCSIIYSSINNSKYSQQSMQATLSSAPCRCLLIGQTLNADGHQSARQHWAHFGLRAVQMLLP